MKSRLPDFLIIGIGRGGTTSLFENLAKHPQVQSSRWGKELNYFNKNYWRGLDWYSGKFTDRRPECLLFEATGSYLCDPPPTQQRIKETVPSVKAIALLRNPTARAWSSYWLYYARPPYSVSIERLMQLPPHLIVKQGIYVDQIIQWHGLFPKENLLILKSEDYFADMRGTLKEVYAFLGIGEIYPAELSRLDPWTDRKAKWGYPAIPAKVKAWLDDFYKPHNERLSIYLGKDFMWSEV